MAAVATGNYPGRAPHTAAGKWAEASITRHALAAIELEDPSITTTAIGAPFVCKDRAVSRCQGGSGCIPQRPLRSHASSSAGPIRERLRIDRTHRPRQ
jgi:hypothetical protein